MSAKSFRAMGVWAVLALLVSFFLLFLPSFGLAQPAPASSPAPASANPSAVASAPIVNRPSLIQQISAPPPPFPGLHQIVGEEGDEELSMALDSPRASVKAFYEKCRAGDFTGAAEYLELPPGADGPRLAMRLKAVLDRYSWVDLEDVSPLSLGNSDDKLPAGVDEIGKIPVGQGKTEPIRIVRRQVKEGFRWLFSRRTLERVDTWYEGLRDRWFLEHLPSSLLRPGPKELLIWQWLSLPVLLVLAWIVGRVMGRLSHYVLSRFAKKTAALWDDELVLHLIRPLRALWALFTLFLVLPYLALYEPAEAFLSRVVRALWFVVIVWGLLRGTDVLSDVALKRWESVKDVQAMRAVVLLVRSVVKVFLLVGAVMVVLSEFGYPATTLITGLGIGGVVLALAAQKTVENLFGSISIGVDKPLRVGDLVKVEDVFGTVELIGLRSTRIRTLARTVVTIPNGRLADMRVESFTLRDRIWLSLTIGLVYGTSSAQMQQVLEGIEKVLKDHPKIWAEDLFVRFSGFGNSSLDIQVMAWFSTTKYEEFMVIRQEVLLDFMRVVEEAGTSIAFPTRTLHLVSEKEKDKEKK